MKREDTDDRLQLSVEERVLLVIPGLNLQVGQLFHALLYLFLRHLVVLALDDHLLALPCGHHGDLHLQQGVDVVCIRHVHGLLSLGRFRYLNLQLSQK